MQYFLILMVGLLQIVSCEPPGTSKSSVNKALAGYEWTILLSGNDSGIEEEKNLIIKSQKDFDNLWNEMYSDRPDQPVKPNVDFTSKWIIACFPGTVSSAGHSIEIKSVTQENDKVKIDLIHTKPGSDCVTAQVIESPFVLVSIDQYKSVETEFKKTVVKSKCD